MRQLQEAMEALHDAELEGVQHPSWTQCASARSAVL